MTTTTNTPLTDALLSRWNKEEIREYGTGRGSYYFSERNQMKRELQKCLSNEIDPDGTRWSLSEEERDPKTLAAYRELFDWDENYDLCVHWNICASSASTNIDCSDKNELKEYIEYGKDIEDYPAPYEIDNIEDGLEVTGEESRQGNVWVSNLRTKDPDLTLTLNSPIPDEEKYSVTVAYKGRKTKCLLTVGEYEKHLHRASIGQLNWERIKE